MSPRRRGRPIARTAVIAGGAAYAGRKSGQRSAENQARESEQEARIRELEAEAATAQQPAAAPPPPPAAAPPADDTIEQLTKLAGLRDAGALTDAEFTAAKQKLLGT
jgi:hypothetical protein